MDTNTATAIKTLVTEIGVTEVILLIIGAAVLYLAFHGALNFVKTYPFFKGKKGHEKEDGITTNINLVGLGEAFNRPQHSATLDVESVYNLSKHPFFANVEYLLTVKMNQTTFSSAKKKYIFFDYVNTKYSIISKKWLEFIKDKANMETDREYFMSQIKKLMIDIDTEVNEEMTRLSLPYKALAELNTSSQMADKLLTVIIEIFGKSDSFENVNDIIYITLNVFTAITVDVVFYDMVINLEKLNGELDNVEYVPISKR